MLAVFFSCGDFLEEDSQTLSYVNSIEDLDELLIGGGYLQNSRATYYSSTEKPHSIYRNHIAHCYIGKIRIYS